MLTLDQLRSIRVSRGLKRSQLADVTAIPDARLEALELRKAEPWFDEAILICRALCTDGILPLIAPDNLAQFRSAHLLPAHHARNIWFSGARLPLSAAVDLADRFGLTDPEQLYSTPLQRQLWEVMQQTERHPEAPGWCPWCAADILGGEAHLPTCLPNLLYAPRGGITLTDAEHRMLVPEKRGSRMKPRSLPGVGLKPFRLAHHLRQQDVAVRANLDVNFYARLERGDLGLTLKTAQKLAAFFDCTVDDLYSENPDTSRVTPAPVQTTPTILRRRSSREVHDIIE